MLLGMNQMSKFGEVKVRFHTIPPNGEALSMTIEIEGYDTFTGDKPLVYIEFDSLSGHPEVLIWADKDQEGWTHRISLEKAVVEKP